ncbi:hypothetical protein LEP1GSC029_3256 [Leptospira interrogans str. 2002000626]|uniref:Transposase n=1 Tax=Leptospira interrogans str. 2002000626 TaxID=996803 RepID=A0A829CXS6_LEPIR|nr:hypothetical protein LEP1GSC029_3256 [Leptospira interrogans str. 2002000626]
MFESIRKTHSKRRQFSTTESGINNLLQWLTLNDIVGLDF